MKRPPEVLTYLLKRGHLNVDEREKLGLWPTETLKFEDIAEHLARSLFCLCAKPWLTTATCERLLLPHMTAHLTTLDVTTLRDAG